MALLAALMITKAGVDILSGFKAKQDAEKQARFQKAMVNMRLEFTQKEIDRAFKSSYTGLMKNYAFSRDNYIKEAMVGIGDTNVAISSNATNINLNNSSFKGDLNAEMDSKLIRNVNTIINNQEQDAVSLADGRITSKLQAEQQAADTIAGIENSKRQADNMAYLQMISGSFDLFRGVSEFSRDIRTQNRFNQESLEREQSFLSSIKNFNPTQGRSLSWEK